jgi:DNA mismatch repair protein MutS2
LVAKIEDRAERARVEREARARTAELKREAQTAARAATSAAAAGQSRPRSSSSSGGGVRIVRDGRIVEAGPPSAAEEPALRLAPSREIRKGDRVRLRSFGSVGIVDKINGDEAEVRVKSLRFREKLSNLDLVEEETPAQPPTGRGERLREQAARSTVVNLRAATDDPRAEINLIGRTTDEAVDEADKFLDEAFLNSLQHVRIIHGHGTGVLRRAIGDFLRNHPHVERYAQAPPDQGGAGATVVELKQ